ncbi:MAG: type II toxin-antitoxin system VapC family toxin [Gemmatimonas sp.]
MIVLDTHTLVWWIADPTRVGARARDAIQATVSAGDSVSVSSISIWEIAMLVAAGRLEFTFEVNAWIEHVEALPFLSFVPVDNRIAARAVQLANFAHRDPADRIIISTALGLGATLLTADARLRAYKPVTTLWD